MDGLDGGVRMMIRRKEYGMQNISNPKIQSRNNEIQRHRSVGTVWHQKDDDHMRAMVENICEEKAQETPFDGCCSCSCCCCCCCCCCHYSIHKDLPLPGYCLILAMKASPQSRIVVRRNNLLGELKNHHHRRRRGRYFLHSSKIFGIRCWTMLLLIASAFSGRPSIHKTFPIWCAALSTTTSSSTGTSRPRIAVIGGGASGIFAAIAASEQQQQQQQDPHHPAGSNSRHRLPQPQPQPLPHVTVFEATSQTLQKVKISGGGRCNVLHDTSKTVSTLLAGYPRGQKELNGLFHKHFTPTMARAWFESRGVTLKTEADGRMFPITDSSQTIMDTLMMAAEEQGVEICRQHKVVGIQRLSKSASSSSSPNTGNTNFVIELKDGSRQEYQAVILATGSAPAGYALVEALEQPMEPRVPSLFTLNAKTEIKEGGLLYGLSGVSVPTARVTLPIQESSSSTTDSNDQQQPKKRKKRNFPSQEGPLLITHHGLSGPAVLRLSAFAAHEFKEQNYRGPILVHWDTAALGDDKNVETVVEELWKMTSTNPKRAVASACPLPNNSIPRRLWSALVVHSGFELDTVWGSASKKLVRALATNLIACSIEVTGKGTFKDEFVTAGGVSLKHMDMKRMESKLHPGIFICGELLNVDGVTGGFNFMNCWSTGYVAGHSAADYCLEQQEEAKSA